MIVPNMHEWVYKRVKGDIAKWVLEIYQPTNTLSVGTECRRRAVSCGPTSTVPTTPVRPVLPRQPKTAPACIPQRRRLFASPSSRRYRHGYVIDDFIDDTGVYDEDSDEDYSTQSSSEDSSSDDEQNDLDTDDDEDEDEVKDLVKQSGQWFPEIRNWPEMEEIYREHDGESSEEDESEDEDVYFIDGQPSVTMRLSSVRKSLEVDELRGEDASQSRRCSSRF
jgi:hypothetical protein